MSLLKRILRRLGLAKPSEPKAPAKPAAPTAPSKPRVAEPVEVPPAEEPAAEEPAAEEPAAEAPAEEPAPAAEAPAAEEPAAEAPVEEPAAAAVAFAAAELDGADDTVLAAWLDRLTAELDALLDKAGVPADRRASFTKGQTGDDLEKRVRSGRHWAPRLRTPLKDAADGTPEAVARGLVEDARGVYDALVGAFETGDGRADAMARLGNLIPHIAGTTAAWSQAPAEAQGSDEVLATLRAALA